MRAVPIVSVAMLLLGAAAPGAPAAAQSAVLGVPVAAAAPPAPVPATVTPAVPGGMRGRSGALRAALVGPLEPVDLGFLAATLGRVPTRYRWAPLHGGAAPGLVGEAVVTGPLQAPGAPGIWSLDGDPEFDASATGRPLAFITRVPFTHKRDGYLNGYHIGTYRTEGGGPDGFYAPPLGFVEVTPESQHFFVSDHFQLRQFLTKDQGEVWPKYVALDLRLIDKLELVLQELNAMGVRAEHLHVMSGFRTPQYNGPGGDGRAALSRHTYGDAADVWVDNDRDGYIDDLNGDGRADLEDARVILRAVDRVEQRHPDLVGGAGMYNASEAHGPFVHIDARGSYARW